MTPEEQCLHDLKIIYRGHKTASANPQWTISERNNKRRVELACPLWTNGAVVSGLRLEIRGFESRPVNRPFMGMSASLLASYREKTWHLSRIDFDPELPEVPSHLNPRNRWNAPPKIYGGHLHPFAENASFGLNAFTQSGNLPLAFPLKKPLVTFNDVLEVIREDFIVPELWLEEPPWSQTLPF